jgi:hypothetical protein
VVVLREATLGVEEVIARGRRMVRDRALAVDEQFLESSNRRMEPHGTRH